MISPRNKVQSILKCLKRCLCFPSWSLIPQGYINVIFSNDRKINSEYHMYFLLGHWAQRTHCDEAYLVIKTELDTSKIYLEMCFKEEQLDLSDHRECAFFFWLKAWIAEIYDKPKQVSSTSSQWLARRKFYSFYRINFLFLDIYLNWQLIRNFQ